MSIPCALIEFRDDDGAVRPLFFSQCRQEISASSVGEVAGVLESVRTAVSGGLYAVGYVSYEASPASDPAFQVREGGALPLAWFGLFDAPAPPPPETQGHYQVSEWTPDVERGRYESCVESARAALAAGETYQVNYTFRMRAVFEGDDFAYYRQLRAAQGAGYSAYLNLGRWRVLSVSPELFFRQREREIITRPMKGTSPRGRWTEEDDERACWLAGSAKNRAENLTIVDLLRNDLSQVTEVGSVHVPQLCIVERYRTVLQMTSTVAATLRADVTLVDIFQALFPCGSVTGAPKISTMRLIAALEESPRQVYCGAIGLAGPEETIFNVAIRTVLIDSETGQAEYGVGGGITWDSAAADEYDEALTKARVLRQRWPDFELLETIRFENGHYWLEERHRRRMAESARYFAFDFPEARVREALRQHAEEHPSGKRRVRLLLDSGGRVRIESTALISSGRQPLPVCLASQPSDAANVFLYHKTTHRKAYDAARREIRDQFDVLLRNEREEATEFTTGNLVAKIGGERWTPPRECGLLGGVYRAELLEMGKIKEKVLSVEDVKVAEQLWHINSVRGWTRVVLDLPGDG